MGATFESVCGGLLSACFGRRAVVIDEQQAAVDTDCQLIDVLGLPCHLWTSLNHLQTWVGRCKATLKNSGLSDFVECKCDNPEQTAEHIIIGCLLYSPNSKDSLFDLGPETMAWLQDMELAI